LFVAIERSEDIKMFLIKTFLVFIFIDKASSSQKSIEFIKDEAWQVWKSGRNKYYKDFGEEKVRYTIWKDNVRRIVEHNEKNANLLLAINDFGDMTNTEFRATMNGYLHNKDRIGGSTFLSPFYLNVPKEMDWRKFGLVSEVKNQGQCGSCWAFSTTGSLEGQMIKKTGKSIDLSEQNLVDCSTSYGNHGCHGGLMDNAFKYIRDNKGIDTEDSYPYEGREGECRFEKGEVGGDDSGFVDIPSGDEDALKNASASVGPISVAIDASHFSFQFYHKGVYDEPECSSKQVDHGVLLVGYGVDEEDGKKYWLVKNSWGEKWGSKGYIKMSRDKNNQCGIALDASYPLV